MSSVRRVFRSLSRSRRKTNSTVADDTPLYGESPRSIISNESIPRSTPTPRTRAMSLGRSGSDCRSDQTRQPRAAARHSIFKHGPRRNSQDDHPWGIPDNAPDFGTKVSPVEIQALHENTKFPSLKIPTSSVNVGDKIPAICCEGTDPTGLVVCRFSTAQPKGKFTLLCLFCGGYNFKRCRSKMFKMEELWRCYKVQGNCQFLAISIKQTNEDVRAFRMGLGAFLTMPIAPDPEGNIFAAFGGDGVPQFYLLDSEYRVVQLSMGVMSHSVLTHMSTLYDETDSEYENILEPAGLSARSPSFPTPTVETRSAVL